MYCTVVGLFFQISWKKIIGKFLHFHFHFQIKQDTELYHENGHLYSNRKAAEIFIEAALWQGLASVMIPGFTINRICWASGLMLNKFASGAISAGTQKVLVTTLGLASVPVIIKPIDRYEFVIIVTL